MTESSAAADPGTATESGRRQPGCAALLLLSVLGLIAAGAAALGTGYGCPWIYFVALGLLGTPFAAFIAWKVFPRRRVLVGFAALAIIALASAAIGARTARPGPRDAFWAAFATPVPPGVTGLTARRQFFDGTITVFRFRASEDAVKSIVAARPLEEEPRQGPWTERDWDATFKLSRIVDRGWSHAPALQDPRTYRWSGFPSEKQAVLLWDAGTGEAYAEYAE